ncbi:MAG: cyclic nucleotide-binding domain-containing protein [Roseiflexaceae bacterium]|nr:cyclic nucleotide-binding domain-containing protein [Roseiflexaceae bacterium]
MSATINVFRNTSERTQYKDGQTIFSAGQPGNVMYVVLSGEVEVRHDNQELARVGPGQPLGEMALIDDAPRSATAVARGDCTLAVIDQKRFLYMVQETPQFALTVMQVLVERLRESHQITMD